VCLDVDQLSDAELRSLEQVFHAELGQQAMVMEALLKLIVENDNQQSKANSLKSAWESRDRQTLLALAQPIYAQLNRNYGVTHFYRIHRYGSAQFPTRT